MSAAYLVMYEGKPEDPDLFLKYYIEKHVPIVWTFPRIRNIEIQYGVDGGDFFMITRLLFDSIQDLYTAINSKQRSEARDDMKNFPRFHGRIRRQAVEILEVQRASR